MPSVSQWFFAIASIYALTGMLWGMHMGASGDHSMYPAHAHWNLLGWVTSALYGTYFALANTTAEGPFRRLPWMILVMSALGAAVLNIPLAMMLKAGEDPSYIPAIATGEFLTVGAMLLFVIAVWARLFRRT